MPVCRTVLALYTCIAHCSNCAFVTLRNDSLFNRMALLRPHWQVYYALHSGMLMQQQRIEFTMSILLLKVCVLQQFPTISIESVHKG